MGYVAHEGIIGISKLTRLVRVVTRRFGGQERMTYQICDALDRMMQPHGVAVYVESHHLCTQMRGAPWADLVSVRRADDHLFLRYRFEHGRH